MQVVGWPSCSWTASVSLLSDVTRGWTIEEALRWPSWSPTTISIVAFHNGASFANFLAIYARRQGCQRFVAQFLAGNTAMRSVFASSGLAPTFERNQGVTDVELDLVSIDRHAWGVIRGFCKNEGGAV